jgi:hypothetical protein
MDTAVVSQLNAHGNSPILAHLIVVSVSLLHSAVFIINTSLP